MYVSTLTAETPIGKVWKKIRSIKGTYKAETYPITVNNAVLTSLQKANVIAKHFQEVSNNSTVSAPIDFDKTIEQANNDNSDNYNCQITEKEISDSIKKAKSTSPGKDMIHNSFLKNIPDFL